MGFVGALWLREAYRGMRLERSSLTAGQPAPHSSVWREPRAQILLGVGSIVVAVGFFVAFARQ